MYSKYRLIKRPHIYIYIYREREREREGGRQTHTHTHTNTHTYFLHGAVLLENLTGSQLKLLEFYGNQRFINAFTTARQQTLS